MFVKKEEIQSMTNRLNDILRQGVKLYLNGEPATPEGIVDQFIREETVYMPDFVLDENGTLTQIRYDKVMEK